MTPSPISVIGLGYVGLPVAVAFGQQRPVFAFDINPTRLDELRNGLDRTGECTTEELKQANLLLTNNPEDLRQASIYIIAVPTPINKAKQPDLKPLFNATETVGKILKPGDLVIYESTVYPGCTEEDCAPLLEKVSGLKFLTETYLRNSGENTPVLKEKGFTIGYSPERINPGDKERTFTTICKVVSGSTSEALDKVTELYDSVVKAGVHRVASIKVAEAAKVIENAQRDLNIAFINELALIFDRLGIDTREVLAVAASKWNFLPFEPGLVGGHCIGVDPYYLTHLAEREGYHPQVILSGRRINDEMGTFVARRTVQELATLGIASVEARVLVLGLTFKEDCPDLRNSRVKNIVQELKNYGCEVVIHDPYCDPEEAKEEYGVDIILDLKAIEQFSAIVLAVAHSTYKEWSVTMWQQLLQVGGIVMDVKGVAPREALKEIGTKVWRL